MAGRCLRGSEIDRIIDEEGFLLSESENSVDYNEFEENAEAQESENGSSEDEQSLEMEVEVEAAFEPAIVGLVEPQNDCFGVMETEVGLVDPQNDCFGDRFSDMETEVDLTDPITHPVNNIDELREVVDVGLEPHNNVDLIIDMVARGNHIVLPAQIGDHADEIIDAVAKGDLGTWNYPLWADVENEPKNIPFFGSNVGVNIPNSNQIQTQLDCLDKFLTEEYWNHIVEQTNLYARKCLADENRRKKKDDCKWVDTDIDEIKSFFALIIIMAIVPKPTLQSYWSKRKVLETRIFSEVMSFKRFRLIMRFLHFADDDQAERGDKLKKLRPMLTYFNNKFKENYTPDQHVSVDESLMKFRGRLSYIQFNRCKRARFGIKFFKICESKTGYCSGFEIYTGKKEVPKGVMVSEEIVMELLQPYLDKGYICYIDNWYSSPNLFKRLLERDTYAVGTVKSNRQKMPKDLAKQKLEVGEARRQSFEGVLVTKWMDKKNVFCMSTLHKDIDFQRTGRIVQATKNHPRMEIMKPLSIVDYNKGMGAVDRQDQVLSYDPIIRRYSKGYKKIFFYMFDMCLFNSYVAFNQVKGGKKYPFVEYKTAIAEQLLQSVQPRVRASSGRPSTSNPTRLQGRHFPMNIPPTENKEFPTKRCEVCKKKGLRKESRIQCKQCVVGLHLECFEAFHTLTKYW